MPVAPPRPVGPPLNALRAFEAAARHGNFPAAAAELSVSPGAVAQHIQKLEEWAGAKLFERHPRGVRLTETAAELVPAFASAFDAIGTAVHALRRVAQPNSISIAALPSVAQLWLSPRLPRLRKEFPGITISVSAMEAPPNLEREPFDIALFPVRADSAAVVSIELARTRRFVVAAPSLAKQLRSPADLAHVPLLHDATWRDDWPDWLSAAGVAEKVRGNTGAVFTLYSLAVEEAMRGAGAMIGHEALVAEAIRARKLVRVFDTQLTSRPPLTAHIRADAAKSLAARVVECLKVESAGTSPAPTRARSNSNRGR